MNEVRPSGPVTVHLPEDTPGDSVAEEELLDEEEPAEAEQERPKPRGPLSLRNWTLVGVMILLAILVPSLMTAMTDQGHMQKVDKIRSDYRAALEACKSEPSSSNDLCAARASLARERAQSELDISRNGSPKSREDAGNRVARAEFLVEREECKQLSGAAMTACNLRANEQLATRRAENRSERIELRAAMRVTDEQNVANYWIAVAKCDGESGRLKLMCQHEAKVRFHQ
ncbi:hypothetical protein BH09PSE6_BH09PSE6_15790 [soil metagenome]